MKIQEYRTSEFGIWLDLFSKLLPDYDVKSLENDLKNLLKRTQQTFFAMENNIQIGFATVSLRHDYVEGASSSPTGYLEGIYLEPDFRRMGIAAKLQQQCEKWAHDQGCIEIGSDTHVQNETSRSFHASLGFTEDDILVHFIKKI